MISDSSAKRQILRFLDLPGYPSKTDELILAFKTAFDKDHEAESFTREWIQFNDEAPKPANIYERGRQLARQKAQQWENHKPGVYECPLCMDMGWVQADGPSSISVGSSKRCACLLAKIAKQKLEGKIK